MTDSTTRTLLVKLASLDQSGSSYFTAFLLDVDDALIKRIREAEAIVNGSNWQIAAVDLRVYGEALAGSEYLEYRRETIAATDEELEQAQECLLELDESRWATQAEIELLSKLAARDCEAVRLAVNGDAHMVSCEEDVGYRTFESDMFDCLKPLIDGTQSLADIKPVGSSALASVGGEG